VLVEEIMHPEPLTIGPETTLSDAFALMRERDVRHLPVVEGGELVGVVTDRDLRYATSRLAERPFPPEARVADVMSRPVHTAHPHDPVERAAAAMRELRIGCLPVVDAGRLVGIVTVTDLVDAILRLTGVGRPSGRLEVRLPDRPGELARLAATLAERSVNIHSILTYPESERRGRVVLRVGTMDIHALAAALCDAGFDVLWPPHTACSG